MMYTEGTGLADAFPHVDIPIQPAGWRILVQLPRVVETTKSGIILAKETKETEKWNSQVAKVLSVGPVAYCHRDSGKPWEEGAWAKPGDYVRVPRWGGDRFEMPYGDSEKIVFVVFTDKEVTGVYTGDPFKIPTYIIYG